VIPAFFQIEAKYEAEKKAFVFKNFTLKCEIALEK
jgi:hypothetical protein